MISLRWLRVSLAAILVTAFATTAPMVPAVENAQVWVFLKVIDRVKEGQKIDIQIPLETLADVGTLRFWDLKHEKILGEVDGPQLLRSHEELPINKEVKVGTFRDADVDVAVVVVSKEKARGGAASRVAVERRDWVKDELKDWAYGPEELDAIMQHYFEGEWKANPRLKDRIEGIDRLRYRLEKLWEIPGFVFLKMEGGDARIVVRTE